MCYQATPKTATNAFSVGLSARDSVMSWQFDGWSPMISRTNGSGASSPLKLATPPARFDVESMENGRPVNLQLEGGG
jgi:hypothetical protein